MAAQSREQRQSSFTYSGKKGLRKRFYLQNCFSFPVSTAGMGWAELLPPNSLGWSAVVPEHWLPKGGEETGRERAFFPPLLSGPFHPCPLSLASTHSAPREGGFGRSPGRLGGWSEVTGCGLWSGRHQERQALGMGPGWIIFLAIVGLNIHSFPLSKLEIPLHWASVWYEERVGRGWKDHVCGFLDPVIPALSSSGLVSGLSGNLDGEQGPESPGHLGRAVSAWH